MKYLVLLFAILASNITLAKTLTFDQAQAYYNTLSTRQVRNIAELTDLEVRDLVLPRSYWKHLTPSTLEKKHYELSLKLQTADNN